MQSPNPAIPKRIPSAFLALVIAWPAGLAAEPGGKTKTPPASPPARETVRLDAMIDALANRNPPPVIVEGVARWVPQFDSNYDWQEQATKEDKPPRKVTPEEVEAYRRKYDGTRKALLDQIDAAGQHRPNGSSEDGDPHETGKDNNAADPAGK